jgi:hypothetical protein
MGQPQVFSKEISMVSHQKILSLLKTLGASLSAFAIAFIASCTSSSGNDAGAPPASCAMPGIATVGPADMHCGTMTQVVDPASCQTIAGTGGDDGGSPDSGSGFACVYGDTMYGMESDDDDCKYHVTWTNLTPICEGAGGVTFKVVVATKAGSPAAGAKTRAEAFITSAADAGCDIDSKHVGPNSGVLLQEAPAGTYTGRIEFDSPGLWTVRFHFHEECFDAPGSPHGHAAYHVTVP